MNTKTAWIAVAVILVLAFAWYAFSAKQAAAPTDTATTTTESITTETKELPGTDPEYAALVTLTDSGFSPVRISIQAGDTVRFLNESSRGMWVGADEHPTHTEYDGTSMREHCADGQNSTGSFDQCQQAATGSFWEYTFEKQGTFNYHNHVGASNTGTIVVE